MADAEPRRSSFYFWTSLYLLTCVVAGFGSTAVRGNYNDVEPFPLYLTLHGLALLAWYSWLVLQTWLVRSRNVALHRRTGIAGVVIAILVVVSTPPVFLNNPARLLARGLDWDSDLAAFPALGIEGTTVAEFTPMIVFGGIANLLSFSLLFLAAIRYRSRPDVHKRMVLFASFALFAPALARISRWPGLGGEGSPFIPIALFATLLAPLLHDRISRGRVHPASWIALGVVLVVQFTAFGFAQSATARALVRELAG